MIDSPSSTVSTVGQVIEALRSGTKAIVPGWNVPGEPRRLFLLPEAQRYLLVEWDAATERICSVATFSDDELVDWLPRNARDGVIRATTIPVAELPAPMTRLAVDYLVLRDATVARLRTEPQSWALLDHGQRILFRAPVGWRLVRIEANGTVGNHCPCDDLRIRWELDAMLARDGVLKVEPVPSDVAAILAAGEQAYAAFQDQMCRGELAWIIHTGLKVVRLPTGYYNTSFAGDAAVGYTRFGPMGESAQEGAMLTAATLGKLAEHTRPVTPAELGSLSALVSQNETSPDDVFAQLEAGTIELCGGGPTTEDIWSLVVRDGQFVQRLGGDDLIRTASDVRALVAARHYHTLRRL